MGVAVFLARASLALGVYGRLDPFKTEAMVRSLGFEVYPVDPPSGLEVPKYQDPENLLQMAEQRFLGQFQGPESVVFHSSGRGPKNVGVADNRILFWSGSSWADFFAYTCPNRKE